MRENLTRHAVVVLTYGGPEEERIFREAFGDQCRRIVFIDRKRSRIVSLLQLAWILLTLRSPLRLLYRPRMQEMINRIIVEEKIDLVHACVQTFGFFSFPPHVLRISDTHEVTYDLYYRAFRQTTALPRKLFYFVQYWLAKRDELRACRQFDALITTTERDAHVFRGVLPGMPVYPVNNGVDPAFLSFPPQEPEGPTIVFTGKMDFYPNVHGISRFVDHIFPQIVREVPDAKLYVVGARPTREILARASHNVIVTGFVDDVRPYMARAAVFVIPLYIGGGIRGKALEAMAMRVPIVTTSIGCESLRLDHEVTALFAEDDESFAAATVRFLRDPELRQRLSSAAHMVVRQHYDWRVKGEQLSAVYSEAHSRHTA